MLSVQLRADQPPVGLGNNLLSSVAGPCFIFKSPLSKSTKRHAFARYSVSCHCSTATAACATVLKLPLGALLAQQCLETYFIKATQRVNICIAMWSPFRQNQAQMRHNADIPSKIARAGRCRLVAALIWWNWLEWATKPAYHCSACVK